MDFTFKGTINKRHHFPDGTLPHEFYTNPKMKIDKYELKHGTYTIATEYLRDATYDECLEAYKSFITYSDDPVAAMEHSILEFGYEFRSDFYNGVLKGASRLEDHKYWALICFTVLPKDGPTS